MTPPSATKRIDRGTWRGIGQRVAGISPLDIPIGGIGVPALLGHLGGTAFRIARIEPHNAVVIDRPPLRLLYVRPVYGGYRYAAKKVFPDTDWAVDFDHVLGRTMARQLGFAYVLLIRIVPSVNRGHGAYERAAPVIGLDRHKLCFANQRILDKWIGRRPRLWNDPERLQPYRIDQRDELGLTLKQAGKWAFAMGVDHSPLPHSELTPL